MPKTLEDPAVVLPKPGEDPPPVDPKPPDPVVEPPEEPAKPPVSDPAPPVVDPTDWEASYIGLQKVVAKKDAEIVKVTTRLDTLTEQFETLKNTSTMTAAEKAKIEKELGEMGTAKDGLESDRDDLKKKLSQSEIIMKEFPALSLMAEYIPAADDDDKFRENAKKFGESLGTFTKEKVGEAIEGATVLTPPGPEDADTSPSREDELWSIINKTAGMEGKEEEFNKANDELLLIQQAKDPNKELSL